MGKYTELAQKTYSDIEKRKINKKYAERYMKRQAELHVIDNALKIRLRMIRYSGKC
jgi:hypothetical protein